MCPLLHALFKREGKKLWIYFIGICIYSSLQYYHRTLFCQTKIPIGRLGFLSSVSLGFEMSHRRNILGTDRKRKPKNRTRLVYQYSFFYATLFSQICLWITIYENFKNYSSSPATSSPTVPDSSASKILLISPSITFGMFDHD